MINIQKTVGEEAHPPRDPHISDDVTVLGPASQPRRVIFLYKELALNHNKDFCRFFLFFITEIDFLFLLHIKSSRSTRVKRLCILRQSAINRCRIGRVNKRLVFIRTL